MEDKKNFKLGDKQSNSIRKKMYEFITKYRTVNPLDDDTFSPYSMYLAFAVLYPGANGETKKQFDKVFGFNEIANDFENGIACLLNINDPPGEQIDLMNEFEFVSEQFKEIAIQNRLALENTLWIDKKFSFKKEYEEISNQMQTALNSADFSSNPENERTRINKHVEKTTHNLIKELLPSGSIQVGTSLVVTNAIYFRDQWEQEFELMQNGIKFNGGGEVRSMHVLRELQSSVSSEVTTVTVPYKHGYYMTIIMPKNMKSFQKLSNFKNIEKLVQTNLNKDTSKTRLRMPLFKLEATANFKDCLIKLGLVDAFQSTANFTNISDKELYISDVFHKAFISVNEKETEAAAATAAVLMPKGCCRGRKPKIIEITIDKPFYAILSKNDALPLFFTKITQPKY
ncbi:Serine protease inhibitor [Entamoeba marina]